MSAGRAGQDPVIVEVDDSTVLDPVDDVRLAAVVVRMPAYFAEHLARVLEAWSDIAQRVNQVSADETELAGALSRAARAARERDRASPELLLRGVRDLLAEYRMAAEAARRRDEPKDPHVAPSG
jgi:hypothetical protein